MLGSGRDTHRRTAQEFGASLVLLACMAVVPAFVSNLYWQGVFLVAIYYALLAAAWNLQFGYAGQISMAPAAFAMIGAYCAAIVSFHLKWPAWAGVLAGTGAALVLGAVVGLIVLRLKGPYLALTTLALAEISRNVIVASHALTRGDIGLPASGAEYGRLTWYYLFLVVLVLVQTGLFFLIRSPAGLYFQAIKDDEAGAATRGVKVVTWKIAAFVIGSGICGLAGALYAYFARVATPEIGVLYQTAIIIAMVVIGGAGTLSGPLLGAIIVWVITELLREAGGYQGVVFAVALLLFARFYPKGLWGFLAAREGLPTGSTKR